MASISEGLCESLENVHVSLSKCEEPFSFFDLTVKDVYLALIDFIKKKKPAFKNVLVKELLISIIGLNEELLKEKLIQYGMNPFVKFFIKHINKVLNCVSESATKKFLASNASVNIAILIASLVYEYWKGGVDAVKRAIAPKAGACIGSIVLGTLVVGIGTALGAPVVVVAVLAVGGGIAGHYIGQGIGNKVNEKIFGPPPVSGSSHQD